MSNAMESDYEVVHSKARVFYETYERKEELQHQTHYCAGCGHGIVHKMLAKAIDDLGIQNECILISPVGCSVFAYHYFDVGNIQAAHGRAPAVATAAKRSHPHSIVISYQGDGDLSAIGSAEILHAANRGENITVIFVNNAIYSMTGGQAAPTTLLGQKSTTTPQGRSAANEGYPLRMSELLATLDAPVYIERVGLGDNKQIAQASRAIKRAVDNQVHGLGFSMIEVLSPCPTIWKMSAVEAQHWVRDVMEKTYPLGVVCDRTKDREPRAVANPRLRLEEIPAILGIEHEEQPEIPIARRSNLVMSISTSAWPVLAVKAFCCSAKCWPRQDSTPDSKSRGCRLTVRRCARELPIATCASQSTPIDSPLVTVPNFLVAMNEPSLRKFDLSVKPGGWVIYNGDVFPQDCERDDVNVLAL